MEHNITYNFDAFGEASDMMRKFVANLSERNARLQIASMAMQAILNNKSAFNIAVAEFPLPDGTLNKYFGVAQSAAAYADALIVELNKKSNEYRPSK